jgi:hypothetical protein
MPQYEIYNEKENCTRMDNGKSRGHAQQRALSRDLWLWWTLATATGGIVSWAIVTVAGLFTFGAALLGIGTATGYCIGWAQKKVAVRYVPHENWSRWLVFSVVGATLGWMTIMALSVVVIMLDNTVFNGTLRTNPAVIVTMPFVGGSVFGLVQWRSLKGSQNMVVWMLASAVGWSLGAVIGVNLAEAIIPYREGRLYWISDAISIFIAGTTATVVFGATTGIVLARLLGGPRSEAQEGSGFSTSG